MIAFLSLFFLYSFLGFLLEVAYGAILRHPKRSRKCLLFLPLCPVYGLGAAAILSLPPAILTRPWALFLAGGLMATLIEYAVGLFYEWGAGVRFWDYSHQPGNLSGLICPLYTLFWGVLSLILLWFLHPILQPLLTWIPPWLTLNLFLCFAADGLLSLILLHYTGTTDCLMWYRSPRRLPPSPDAM